MGATLRREPSSSGMTGEAVAPEVMTEGGRLGRFIDVGRTGDSLFVAMEFVDGTTLQAWLTAAPRPWSEVLSVCLQAGRGLEAAHAAGIIHRDFKPANVLVGKDGRARVTDFGLARTSGHVELPSTPVSGSISLDTPLTVAGSVMGTPGYMAPEQYLGQPSTPATDQYAFCATLYEALYGQRPFVGADLQTLARLTQQGAVPSPPKGSSVPAWLFPVIARGLSPNPAQRHPSMRALLELLERDPSARRRRVMLSAAAVVVAFGVTAALVAWPRVRASRCHRQTEQLASVWNGAARARVEQAFLATKQPFAAMALDLVRTNLDGFTAAWTAERHRDCDDTLLHQTRTERQLSLRLACLENRRVELQTLASRFQEADAELVSESVAAVTRLTTVERCANVGLLEERAALSDAVRRQAEAVEQQLSHGRMLVALGRFDDARTVLATAVREARASSEAQTLALALLEWGQLERVMDQYAAARASLEEAMRLALMVGDDRTALHATALLTSLVGWRLVLPREALVLANVGRGLVARVGDPVLEALLEEGEADARWQAGDGDGALTAYRRAREQFAAGEGPTSLDVARMHSSIGWVLMERGSLTEARVEYERSRRLREALLGVEHPTLGPTWSELGHLAEELDDREAALSYLRRAYELRLRTRGASASISARSAINLARALATSGRLDEATQLFGPAAEVLSADRHYRFNVERSRALLLLATGDGPGAREAAKVSIAVADPGDEFSLAEGDTVLGLAQVLCGDDAARGSLERALLRFEQLKLTRTQNFVVSALALARLAARHETPDSRAIALRAHEAALMLEGNTRLKAQTSLQLAKAHLANGALDQARQLAEKAITFAVEPDQQALKAEAERFLAEHPLE